MLGVALAVALQQGALTPINLTDVMGLTCREASVGPLPGNVVNKGLQALVIGYVWGQAEARGLRPAATGSLSAGSVAERTDASCRANPRMTLRQVAADVLRSAR